MNIKTLQLSALFIAFYALNHVDMVKSARDDLVPAPPEYNYRCTNILWGLFRSCRCTSSQIAPVTEDTQDMLSSISTQSYQSSGRKKRSGDLNEEGYVNGTIDEFVVALDENCDGYLDVTEWVKKAPLSDFVDILNAGLDKNGDGRLTLEEMQDFGFQIYPTKMYVAMPMDMYEEMKTVMDNQEEAGAGEGEGKGRKGEA